MLAQMLARLMKLGKNQDGQGMVEYGLIIALVAVAVIATLTLMGGQLKTLFTNILTTLTAHSAP